MYPMFNSAQESLSLTVPPFPWVAAQQPNTSNTFTAGKSGSCRHQYIVGEPRERDPFAGRPVSTLEDL